MLPAREAEFAEVAEGIFFGEIVKIYIIILTVRIILYRIKP